MSESDPSLRPEAKKEFHSVVGSTPDDYLAAAQLGLLYLADQRDDDAAPLSSGSSENDPATANRVRMALHMPLVLEDHKESESALNPRVLGERSYNAGFLKDALRYFTLAYEPTPSTPRSP